MKGLVQWMSVFGSEKDGSSASPQLPDVITVNNSGDSNLS